MEIDPLLTARPVPRAFVDAGDLPWVQLEPILRRYAVTLAPGEVAELRTGDPLTIEVIDGWCEEHGHVLIHREPGDGVITFWVGRLEEDSEPVDAYRPWEDVKI